MDRNLPSSAGPGSAAASAATLAAGSVVHDLAGVRAEVVRPADPRPDMLLLRLDDGRYLGVPTELLSLDASNAARCAVRFDELAGPSAQPDGRAARAADPAGLQPGERFVIPVIEETVQVDKRVVTRGGWRITKTVDLHEQVVDEPLTREEVTVERVAVERVLPDGEVPAVRQNGDTMVVPVVEEVLVVEKRLLLKEELHVRRVRKEFRAPQQVVLRRERVSVDRIDERGDSAAAASSPAQGDLPGRLPA